MHSTGVFFFFNFSVLSIAFYEHLDAMVSVIFGLMAKDMKCWSSNGMEIGRGFDTSTKDGITAL
jgi:hypothetical protein